MNQSEISLLQQDIYILVGNYIRNNILDFSNPYFNTYIYIYVNTIITIQLSLCDIDMEIVDNLIYETIDLYFIINVDIPPRQEKYIDIDFSNEMKKQIDDQIKRLDKIIIPAQRTEEWYLFRDKVLTASNIWKAFSTQSNINSLIYSKCVPSKRIKKSKAINPNSPLHYGQKYEPVSTMWYEHQFNTKIGEYGCLPHKQYKYLAASPDGINIDKTNSKYGTILEIKNIVNREITGIPKLEYWIQMQIQLEVLDLYVCDFLETQIKEYDNYEEFIQDGTFNKTKCGKQKGVVILFTNSDGDYKYEYSALDLTLEKYEEWNRDIVKMNELENYNWISTSYWRLEKVLITTVQRNKAWFKVAKPVIENIYNIILKERKTGYQHRAPKSRKTKTDPETKCMIPLEKTDSINLTIETEPYK